MNALIAKIEAAFADTPHPGPDGVVFEGSSDYDMMRAWYGFHTWRELLDELRKHHEWANPLLDMQDEAFRYFLPAHLIHALTMPDPDLDMTIESLLPEFVRDRVELFAPREREAVAEYLEYRNAPAEAVAYWGGANYFVKFDAAFPPR